ncbi:MAG: tetratricopeptide repeat protein [Pseudomonadota bacterium]|nr:tetratricopeptide repeat protein [Pseudomonadota bacterium]
MSLAALVLAIGSARAEIPPPDYRDALMAAAADEVSRLARQDGLDAATKFAKTWARQIGPDARLVYELGLASRLSGRPDDARRWLDRAVELDPLLVAARYDRGEVLLSEGDLDGAEADFREVARLAPDQWAGHFRLADVAGRKRDAPAFEAHLLDALRHGFSFRSVVGDPRWHGYLADAELGPIVRRLVVVYQDEGVLDALERPPE